MNSYKAFDNVSGKELKEGDLLTTCDNEQLTFVNVDDAGYIVTRLFGQKDYYPIGAWRVENFPSIIIRKHNPLAERKTVETIDMTPTWVSLVPLIIAALEDGTEAGKTIARDELKRMAQAADAYNASLRK